jgi:endonuclease YncB( thermonuclease family)
MYGSRLFPRSPLAPFRGRLGLVLVLLLGLAVWKTWPMVRLLVVPPDRHEGRLRVADGDSLELDGVRLRLEGIDAPELDQSCSLLGAAHPCGREAREHLLHLIAGRPVTCVSRDLDRYGRHLGRCRAGDTDLNAEMVRTGWAVAYGAYDRQEAEARAHGRGLWSGDFTWPQEFRREKRERRDIGWFERWLDGGR